MATYDIYDLRDKGERGADVANRREKSRKQTEESPTNTIKYKTLNMTNKHSLMTRFCCPQLKRQCRGQKRAEPTKPLAKCQSHELCI